MRFLAFFTLFLLYFPNYSALNSKHTGANSETPVPVIPLIPRKCPWCSFSSDSGIKEKLRLVIRDRDAWREVWTEINMLKLPSPRLPEIDFSQEMVVVAGLGTRGSAGYGIIVDHAYEQDNQLEIAVVSRSPGSDCVRAAVMTAPVDIVRLPKMEASVVFRETELVQDCK